MDKKIKIVSNGIYWQQSVWVKHRSLIKTILSFVLFSFFNFVKLLSKRYEECQHQHFWLTCWWVSSTFLTILSIYDQLQVFVKSTSYSFFVFFILLDHDECRTGSHGCQQKCFNLHGSYYCECLSGYQLNIDKMTCSG